MADPRDWFAGRVAVLATMHRKEQAIAPLLDTHLGVSVAVPTGFDTDAFGTFTGDVKRPSDQLTTARLKAAAVLRQTGESLAVASEGSFGPHPQIPFVACDRELVLLIDRTHQLEIVGECLSTDTNYRSQVIRSSEEALAFAESVGFPQHGLVVKDGESDQVLKKGITDGDELLALVEAALSQSPHRAARLETDMRALYNPTRMAVIAQATEDLIKAIARACPGCGCPGFSAVKQFPGLPCSLCGTPTLLTLAQLYRCQHCQFEQRLPGDHGFATADPSYCPYCNP
ncbi:hypothetical protein IQ265_15020 [Nodosilinea sp. LEGE 06152]|uniref:DUF6671 family protein n=1 Tax=Nodosilinea sp. LEGE 06152 TaxID=2777966 RepID=UPI00187EA451|nr:DUF6671 family protein [Nodosilinea sp. LEGE 06152]MBE9158129.1 hypothetical protein [Nodosilinea sp. LEGE 06152]